MINLTMLGTGGGMPIPKRYLSSCMINYEGRKILIDAGEGTQVAMREFHTGFKAIDLICITHFHGDHIFGLPGLLSTMEKSGRREPITIIGPLGLKKFIDAFLLTLRSLDFEINIIEGPIEDLFLVLSNGMLSLNKDKKADSDIKISTIELEHSLPCLGYSFYVPRKPKFHLKKAIEKDIPKEFWSNLQDGETVEDDVNIYSPDMVLGDEREGIKFSYITDTRPIEKIVDFIKDSDLFISEGTYGDDANKDKAIEYSHMTYREAAKLAKSGNVKELLLTHFSVRSDNPEEFKTNAREVFQNTTIAYDGYSINLSYED